MSNDTSDEPFFSRWSRQKKDKQQASKQKPVIAQPPRADTGSDEAPEIDPATLPKIDDLTAESDVSVFLRKGVPEGLQKLALRRMWSLDPEIRDFVEMAENQFDFHAPGGIPGLFQELPEGADVSVWLAQATQSVPREDPKQPTSAAQAKSGTDQDQALAAAQQETSVDVEAASTDAARAEDLATTDTGAPQTPQEPETAENLSPASAALPRQETLPPRRRHGGALPA
jgi:Protein of unknown function (DUF3306)